VPLSLEALSVRRITLAVSAALVLVLGLAATALGWVAPVLVGNCAPDEDSYAWTITLHQESNQNIEFSWNADFSDSWTQDFGTAGPHDFETPRGGSTLYARYVSDHNADTSAAANSELCEPPGEPDIDLDKYIEDGEGGLVEEVTAGDPVTYTYEITNIGDLDLDVEFIEDLIVSSPTANPGDPACEDFTRVMEHPNWDADGDEVLEPEETWVLTCTVEDGLPEGETTNEACVYANVVVELEAQPVTQDYDVHDCADYTVNATSGGEGGGQGTPQQSLVNSATSLTGETNPLLTLVFSLVLLTSLGSLAYVNVKAARR
jgi:hypothetical protein